MAINGTISIFRVTNAPDTETLISDKIEFNGDAVTPDAKSFIKKITPIMSIVGQENDTPDSNDPSLLDETGLAFTGLEIEGYFDDRAGGTRPIAITTLRNWMRTDKKNANFEFGRFGYRNDISTEFQTLPTATSGYILEEFQCPEEYGETLGKIDFLIKLRWQGDITNLGVL